MPVSQENVMAIRRAIPLRRHCLTAFQDAEWQPLALRREFAASTYSATSQHPRCARDLARVVGLRLLEGFHAQRNQTPFVPQSQMPERPIPCPAPAECVRRLTSCEPSVDPASLPDSSFAMPAGDRSNHRLSATAAVPDRRHQPSKRPAQTARL